MFVWLQGCNIDCLVDVVWLPTIMWVETMVDDTKECLYVGELQVVRNMFGVLIRVRWRSGARSHCLFDN